MSQACVHGLLVNGTCVCDLLWEGNSCERRDCQSGQLENGACVCRVRHAGEFCEFQVCYHKDTLYCWGLKDVEFLPCNASAIGDFIDPTAIGNPAWYCPCGEGRRTQPPYSHCVCNDGYSGEFCEKKICGSSTCGSLFYDHTPPYDNSSGAIAVPDSAKVAIVCMTMVLLVGLLVWLKRFCLHKRGTFSRHAGNSRSRRHHLVLTPSRLNAALLMIQTRHGFVHDWENATPDMVRGSPSTPTFGRSAPLPTYEEVTSAPPSYATVMIAKTHASGFKKSSVASCNTRKKSAAGDAEFMNAGIQHTSASGQIFQSGARQYPSSFRFPKGSDAARRRRSL